MPARGIDRPRLVRDVILKPIRASRHPSLVPMGRGRVSGDFTAEWEQIGAYLRERGGLEAVICRNAVAMEPAFRPPRRTAAAQL